MKTKPDYRHYGLITEPQEIEFLECVPGVDRCDGLYSEPALRLAYGHWSKLKYNLELSILKVQGCSVDELLRKLDYAEYAKDYSEYLLWLNLTSND